MSEELGKIEKPSAERFAGTRKLLLMPLLFAGDGAPQEFMEKYHRYWSQAGEQMANMEIKLGNISRIYHEMLTVGGEEGIKILEQLNAESSKIVSDVCERGAKLTASEDSELVTENMDWERCLMMAMGEKVRTKITEFLLESNKNRYEFFVKTIDETLGSDETGLLLIREGHGIQFPQDIEVFNIYPPVLDEINRWIRDYSSRPMSDSPKDAQKSES